MTPEFSRPIDLRHFAEGAQMLEPTAEERKALAERVGIVAVKDLRAELALTRDGPAVLAKGRMVADIVQSCAVSGEDLPVHIDEPIALRFAPTGAAPSGPDEEFELAADDLDTIDYEGSTIDLGEAVAQSLSLAIDPYLTGPNADAARREHGLDQPDPANPFAALRGLKRE